MFFANGIFGMMKDLGFPAQVPFLPARPAGLFGFPRSILFRFSNLQECRNSLTTRYIEVALHRYEYFCLWQRQAFGHSPVNQPEQLIQ